MPFSASTCLTNSGTVALGGTFNIYSNVDQYFNAFQTNVSYDDLFDNCPYIMGNVPNGTTSIKIIDTFTKCCATIELLSNDLCTTCDLYFDDYETTNIGRIVAGNLTGSCDTEISDYKIFWYGPNSTTNIAFTSGFGNEFSPYDFTHPLTGINSPMQPSGVYIPVIDKVKLNGLDFSQTGGTGYIQSELECFNGTTVEVFPFTCDNGTVVGDYTHRVNFAGASEGVTPLTLNSTFELDVTTNYFAWKFNGESVPDTLKITFYGSSYSEPIILEFITIGAFSTQFTSNLSLLTLPKSAATPTNTSYLSKVTDLSNLTINSGDYLILEVIPNPNNPTTNWDFYFTCLNTFDCSLCLDNYLNTPYKIKTSSITNISGTCGLNTIVFDLSACTQNQITSSDIYKYMVTTTNSGSNYFGSVLGSNITSLITRNIQTRINYTQCGKAGNGYQTPTCFTPSSNGTISFLKTVSGLQGVIDMTFTDLNDLISYKTSYESKKSASGWINDSTNIDYYKYGELSIPNSSGNQTCGDGTTELQYNIHFSSVITTGQTSNNYTLRIPMPTIQNNMNFTNCDVGCSSSVDTIVNDVNTSSTGTTNNRTITSNVGSRYIDPVSIYWYVSKSTSNSLTGIVEGSYGFNNSLNSTLPFSGSSSPYTPIPALSSQTCDFSSKGITTNPNTQFQSQLIYVYDYQITQGGANNTYTIKANPIVNGVRTSTNYPDTVVTVVNGSIVGIPNPLYTF